MNTAEIPLCFHCNGILHEAADVPKYKCLTSGCGFLMAHGCFGEVDIAQIVEDDKAELEDA